MQGDQAMVQMKVLASLRSTGNVGSSSAVKKVLLEVIAYLALVRDTLASYSNSQQTYSIIFSSLSLKRTLYTLETWIDHETASSGKSTPVKKS